MDHGILNTPLKSRGNINAQIDRFKADQAAEAAAARKARAGKTAEGRKVAKALLAGVSADRLRTLAAHSNCTVAALKSALKSEAHWNPDFVITVLG